VVAIWSLLSLKSAVGAVGVPVNTGLSISAFSSSIAFTTIYNSDSSKKLSFILSHKWLIPSWSKNFFISNSLLPPYKKK
jgi:hypothetical protein